ncbi:MAG: hypothetical protein Kow0029_26350 [Candidatus Rifleibacteriota bacterium]
MAEEILIDTVNTKELTTGKRIIVGMQMLFVAFGALVLVPLLTGLDPSIALFTAGLGTLIFHAITRGKEPVMGGIMVLLCGMIASIGAQTLVRNKIDFQDSRNLVIVSLILVFGIGDMSFEMGQLKLAGISLAGIVGVILNLILFWGDKSEIGPTVEENTKVEK